MPSDALKTSSEGEEKMEEAAQDSPQNITSSLDTMKEESDVSSAKRSGEEVTDSSPTMNYLVSEDVKAF